MKWDQKSCFCRSSDRKKESPLHRGKMLLFITESWVCSKWLAEAVWETRQKLVLLLLINIKKGQMILKNKPCVAWPGESWDEQLVAVSHKLKDTGRVGIRKAAKKGCLAGCRNAGLWQCPFISLGERECCLVFNSFAAEDVFFPTFLRAPLLHSLQEKAAWKAGLFTTPLAGGVLYPTGGLTA